MALLVATIKHYWKFLLILATVCSALATGASWVGKVDSHVEQGIEKIKEFDQSQQGQARMEGKLDAVKEKVDEMSAELKEMKKQNDRIERKLERSK
jgi:peptidoglycan hydrolase CwlO-like protein